MKKIALHVGFGVLILLTLPISVWLMGWHWQPTESNAWLHIQFWATESVSMPFGVLTTTLLTFWFIRRLSIKGKKATTLAVMMVSVILVGQGISTLIKNQVKEARPYALWLAEQNKLDVPMFYAQDLAERKMMLSNTLQDLPQLPEWQKQHWQHETGFAFPSGHTLFASSWALLAIFLLWPQRRYFDVIALMGWAGVVGLSRLTLGMHWPQDLASSMLLSFGLVMSAATFWRWKMGVGE